MNTIPHTRMTSRKRTAANTKTISSLYGSIILMMTFILHQKECNFVASFTVVSPTTTTTPISTILQYANDPPEPNEHFRQAFESLQQITITNNPQTPEMTTPSTPTSLQLPPITNKHQQAWNDKYVQLAEYYQRHGHSNVPSNYPSNPTLSTWVLHQRQCGKKNTLSHARKQALEALQFQWNTRTCWNQRYQQLVEYKSKFGDCFVPTNYKSNPQLGRWLANQKQHYRMQYEQQQQQQQQQDSRTCSTPPKELISPERIQKLIDIGAIVVMDNDQDEDSTGLSSSSSSTPHQQQRKPHSRSSSSSKSVRDIHWYQRYQELVQYQSQHGHCHVPRKRKSDKQQSQNSEQRDWTTLGNWVDTQRTNYRALMKDQPSPMTLERKQLLEDIGFHLPLPPSTKTTKTSTEKKQKQKARTTSQKKSKSITQRQDTDRMTVPAAAADTDTDAEKTIQSTVSVYSGKPRRRTTTAAAATVQNWSKRRITTTNHTLLLGGIHSSGTNKMSTSTQQEQTNHHPFVTIEMTNDEKLAAWRNRFKALQ